MSNADGACSWWSTASSTATGRSATGCEARAAASPPIRQRDRAAPLSSARHESATPPARRVRGADRRRRQRRDARDPRPLRHQAALLRGARTANVFFASEIKALLALGVPARGTARRASGGIPQVARRDRIRRHPHGAAGLLRHRQRGEVSSIRIGTGISRPPRDAAETARTPRSSPAFARCSTMPSASGWSPTSRWPRISAAASTPARCSGSRSARWIGRSAPIPSPSTTRSTTNPRCPRPGRARRRDVPPDPGHGARDRRRLRDAIWHAETPLVNGHGVAKFLLSRAVRAAGSRWCSPAKGPTKCSAAIRTSGVDALIDNAALSAGESRRCSLSCSAPIRRRPRC